MPVEEAVKRGRAGGGSNPEKFKVTYSSDSNGVVSATLDGKSFFSGGSVEKGKVLVFTAISRFGYQAVWGADFTQDTSNKNKATITVTKETTVKVSFSKIDEYVKVRFSDLNAYLANSANMPAVDGCYYIEVTDIQAADLKGAVGDPSALGEILKDNGTKKFSLKLPKEVPGLTNMQYCFSGCENLTQAPAIPSGVTDMYGCFAGCTNLTQAPAIPSGVTDMSECFARCENLVQAPAIPSGVTNMGYCFYGCSKITSVTLKCAVPSQNGSAFSYCSSLTAGSIKVPRVHFDAYKAAAYGMGADPEWFTAED